MTHHCNKCKLAIDTDKERHLIIQDNDGKKQLSKVWLHKECWKEMMINKEKASKLQEEANKFLNFAKEKLGMEEKITIA